MDGGVECESGLRDGKGTNEQQREAFDLCLILVHLLVTSPG